VNVDLKGMEYLSGTYIGLTDINPKKPKFPMMYLHVLRESDGKEVRLLVFRDMWYKELALAGFTVSPGMDNIKVAVGIYEYNERGETKTSYIFEGLVEVTKNG
jgi:hypothetical protein